MSMTPAATVTVPSAEATNDVTTSGPTGGGPPKSNSQEPPVSLPPPVVSPANCALSPAAGSVTLPASAHVLPKATQPVLSTLQPRRQNDWVSLSPAPLHT